MKPGDFLIYGNGHRVEIVNFPTVNGRSGVQVNDPQALFASERFKIRAEVDQMVALGIWKIEGAAPTAEGEKK